MEQKYSYQKLMVRKRKRTFGGEVMTKKYEDLGEIVDTRKNSYPITHEIHSRMTESISKVCEGIDKTIWKVNSTIELIWCLLFP